MNIKQTLIWATNKLKIKTASLDAEVLLSNVLKKPKEFLYTYPEKELTNQQTEKFKKLISRRAKFEPIAYLTNQKEFYGLNFYVDKCVLIPRPETELLVEEVLSQIYKLQTKSYKITIADIGTGSGCIAITLAKHLPKATIYAADISKTALTLAKKNAKKHQVKIKFYQGDLIKPLKNKKIDLIVANLPYLDDNYKNLLKSSNKMSLKFEPKMALRGGKFGLDVYQRLFIQINQLKNKPKLIIGEIPHCYLNQTKKLTKKYFLKKEIIIKKDLAGLNRILIIKNYLLAT